jgi:signal peptidase II
VSDHGPVAERRPDLPESPAAPGSEPPRQFARFNLRRDAPFFLIALGVVVLDQITKGIVRNALDLYEAWPEPDMFVNIVYFTNSGAAFGILQGQTLFLIGTSLVGLAAIVLYYLFPPMEHGLLRVALGLQLGGAIGNLIDRIRFGEVTDFINFRFWPAFNVADASISIGVVTILWFFLTAEGDRVRHPEGRGDTASE